MNAEKYIAILLTLAFSCLAICACRDIDTPEQTIADAVNTTDAVTDMDVPVTPVQIDTTGGVVIIGDINFDDQGWYIQPEQPLNISFEYFLDNPSVFTDQTRIKMFAPELDGVEKSIYIGKTVTAAGTFGFYRDDFETIYFTPYTITVGKSVERSYGAPDLMPPQEPENLYDPSKPLPKYMDAMIEDGTYFYNAFMLSRETLEYAGNDFADFYVGFVDAFLNYKEEFPCPEKSYAETLSLIVYYELPLYNACAEPIEVFRHYNSEKGTLSIKYKHGREEFDRIVKQFFDAANEFLADAKPEQTDYEKAKNIYHALCTRMTYDYSALEDIERKENYYAYLYNSGVCITFANVYNQLLTQVGIQSTLAQCDNIDGIGHAWSIITIDKKQYFCDPTFELSYDGGSGYRFFGMNYAERTADATGELGIRYGRYRVCPMDAEMIAAEPLDR